MLYFIETLLEWQSLNDNAKKMDILIFVIGCIVSFCTSLPWFVGGMLALAIYNAITTVIDIAVMIFFVSK